MYFLIAAVSLLASLLTFFSGFGLGTLLLPVFALFFDLPTSIALTALVHFLNNCFKIILVGKKISKTVFLRFGIPSLVAAFSGAFCLKQISGSVSLMQYSINGHVFSITLLGLVLGCIILFFALWEVIPYFEKLSFNENKLMLGGFVSGFFGGLSGHQGALRTAFLMRLKLDKEIFVATGIGIACLVDVARMSVYAVDFRSEIISQNYKLLGLAVFSAWTGALIGNKLVKKTTFIFIKWFITVFMCLIAIGVIMGILGK
jgi:uncharacterized membrane protein YfcA